MHFHPFNDTLSAYLAGDFLALYDLEMREQYGDHWEHRVTNEYATCSDTIDDDYEHEVELPREPNDLEMFEPGIEDDCVPF